MVEANLTLSSLGGAVTDGQVPNTITLDNITQITTRSHTSLSDIGTNAHSAIDTHIAATAAHGATGAVVGTTNTQTLTGKTLTEPVLTLEQGISVAPTAEGRIAWDTDDNKLKVGDGVGTKTISTDDAAAITGGSITGIADLAVADGGTGASTAADARTNLGAAATSHTHAESDVTNLVADLALKAPLASPTFTGTVTAAALTTTGAVTIGDADADTLTLKGLFLTAQVASPTIAKNANLGSTGTASITWGGDTNAVCSLVTGGTGIAAGTLAAITFVTTRAGTNYVPILQAISAAAADANIYVTSRGTTGFSIACRNVPSGTLTIGWLLAGNN